MTRTVILVLGVFLAVGAASPALAAGESPVAPTDSAPPPAPVNHAMRPLDVDLRLTADTDILLIYVDLGAGVDVGLLPIGPGTLSLGAEFDFGFCATACVALSALTGMYWGMQFYQPMGRLAYHLDLMRVVPKGSFSKVDAFGLVTAGPVIARSGVSSPDGTVSVVGQDTSLGFGLGAGGNFFINDHLYIGAEARFRYARGRYDWTFKAGSYTFTDSQSTWSLTGVNVLFFAGYRL